VRVAIKFYEIGEEQKGAFGALDQGNLRLIDHAKQQWALANNKGADDVPTLADITPYLPPRTQLFCPGGGAYTINAVNVAPTCNIPGHVIR